MKIIPIIKLPKDKKTIKIPFLQQYYLNFNLNLINIKNNMDQFIDSNTANNELESHKRIFSQKSKKISDKPVTSRQCNDICCLVFFIIFFLSFIAYSAYSIKTMAYIVQFDIEVNLNGSVLEGIDSKGFKIFAVIMFSCLGGAFFVSLLLCALLCLAPFYGIMIMAFSACLPVFALAIFLVVLAPLSGKISAYFFFIGILSVISVLAYGQALKRAAILMKTVKVFILQNPRILILVGICLFYCLLVVCLWCLGFYSFCMLYSQKNLTYGGFVGISIFWAFLLLFFNFYFYYTSVFLTCQSIAIWFYQKQGMDPLSTPLKHMIRYHLGTITFASLILALISILKFLFLFGKCKQRQLSLFSFIGKCCSLILCCCVGTLEVFVQILNSYAIIASSLTGQSFVDSAKIIGHIANQDQKSFKEMTVSCQLIRFGSIIFTTSIPTLIGTILLNNYLHNTYLTIIGSLLIMFTTSIIGMTVLQVFIQSVSSLFVMYRIDSEIGEFGHEATWIKDFGDQLSLGFDTAFRDQVLKKPKPKYRDVTTIVIHENGVTEIHKNRIQIASKKNIKKTQHQHKRK